MSAHRPPSGSSEPRLPLSWSVGTWERGRLVCAIATWMYRASIQYNETPNSGPAPESGQSRCIHPMDRLLGMCERGHSTPPEKGIVPSTTLLVKLPPERFPTLLLAQDLKGKKSQLCYVPPRKKILSPAGARAQLAFWGVPSGLRIPGQRKYPALQVPIETKSPSRSGSNIDPAALLLIVLPRAVLAVPVRLSMSHPPQSLYPTIAW